MLGIIDFGTVESVTVSIDLCTLVTVTFQSPVLFPQVQAKELSLHYQVELL